MILRFLKAKHWQLFILTFGIPLIFQIVMMVNMMSKIDINSNPEPTMIISIIRFLPIIMLFFIAVFFGWFWSVAIGLQSKIPEDITMKIKQFKALFFIPLAYLLILVAFTGYVMGGFIENSVEPNPLLIGGLIAIMLPLHLFSMFCIFHSIYFVAKTFKTVELQKEVSFSDFVGEFFMLWFYPIGIWIVQPKINTMIER